MIDIDALAAAVATHGRVARVVIASYAGSSPREVGAAMLVWADGQSGTVGGGALEWQAAASARTALSKGDRLDRVPLGPALGQCCGGAVVLLTEVWDAARLAALRDDAYVRPLPGTTGDMPLRVARRLQRARNGEVPLADEQMQGWMIEPFACPTRPIWVWGAGHVGRALVGVLAPLPGVAITWVDIAAARFPDVVPQGVEVRVAPDPADLVPGAPRAAEHLIVTFSHALDLELCHRLLTHGFARAGLIGSATKWARFRARLAALGHAPGAVARIDCPMGDPSLGKHPQAIAIGVAAVLLQQRAMPHRQEATQ